MSISIVYLLKHSPKKKLLITLKKEEDDVFYFLSLKIFFSKVFVVDKNKYLTFLSLKSISYLTFTEPSISPFLLRMLIRQELK
jgi:hypothetical protein